MKSAAGILSLILLASCVALAKDKAQLEINDNPEAVKRAAVDALKEAGYSLRSQEPTSIVFTKEMTGGTRFFTLYMLSPASCGVIAPRFYLTLNFSDTGQGTLVTISAMIEHTALVEHPPPMEMNLRPKIHCETVLEAPIFMRTQEMLDGLLEDIRSETMTKPRESVSHTLSIEP